MKFIFLETVSLAAIEYAWASKQGLLNTPHVMRRIARTALEKALKPPEPIRLDDGSWLFPSKAS